MYSRSHELRMKVGAKRPACSMEFHSVSVGWIFNPTIALRHEQASDGFPQQGSKRRPHTETTRKRPPPFPFNFPVALPLS